MANFVSPFEKWGCWRCRFRPSWHYSTVSLLNCNSNNKNTRSYDSLYTFEVFHCLTYQLALNQWHWCCHIYIANNWFLNRIWNGKSWKNNQSIFNIQISSWSNGLMKCQGHWSKTECKIIPGLLNSNKRIQKHFQRNKSIFFWINSCYRA